MVHPNVALYSTRSQTVGRKGVLAGSIWIDFGFPWIIGSTSAGALRGEHAVIPDLTGVVGHLKTSRQQRSYRIFHPLLCAFLGFPRLITIEGTILARTALELGDQRGKGVCLTKSFIGTTVFPRCQVLSLDLKTTSSVSLLSA